MQNRLAILMMADMVDYSRIMDSDPETAIQAVRDLKSTYLEPVSESHGGEVLKRMGDGWIFAYPSVASAVQCAMDVQAELVSHQVIKLRIGVHIGEIVHDEDDFYGPGANIVQRIQAESPPGGLMVSQDLYRQLPEKVSKAFLDAGNFNLKNIALPLNLFQWRPKALEYTRGEDVPTIAVEPFAFAPENTETQAGAEDLRDQLIVRLSRRTGVRILDDAAGQAENSIYQLRGRLRLAGNRGRLNLSLTRRQDSAAVWSQGYEGDPSDIFRFCDDVIDRADSDLRVQINAFDGDRIADLPDDRLSVSELRSRAAAAFYRLTFESWEYARDLIERALRLKPDDSMSLGMRVEALVLLAAARYQGLGTDEGNRLERDLNAVIEASPRSDYAFWTRSLFRVHVRRDMDGALEDARRTLLLSPAYAPGHEVLGLANMLCGDFQAAEYSLEKSISLSESDPLWPYRWFMLATSQLCQNKPTEAAKSIEKAIQLRPNQRSFLALQAECHRQGGNESAARDVELLAVGLPREPSILAPRPPLPDGHHDLLTLLAPTGSRL